MLSLLFCVWFILHVMEIKSCNFFFFLKPNSVGQQ